jgi:hypothetical protein
MAGAGLRGGLGLLEKRGLSITRQQGIPVVYEEVRIHPGFFADLVVEDQVIVEIKAVETVTPVHKKQHHLFEAGGQASGAAPQLQRSPDQERHRPDRQRTQRMISRKVAKVAKKTLLTRC